MRLSWPRSILQPGRFMGSRIPNSISADASLFHTIFDQSIEMALWANVCHLWEKHAHGRRCRPKPGAVARLQKVVKCKYRLF